MKTFPPTILVFVDGIGLGVPDGAVNPVYSGACPNLAGLLEHDAKAVDACLGVAGLPQSATGQTALLTGINASKIAGRHVEGFPGPVLRKIIREHNIYVRLRNAGFSSTFANAYFTNSLEEVRGARLQSVTTVAALSAFGKVRLRRDLEEDRAVYHDLTRESLLGGGYAGPLVSPSQAAAHLVAIALEHDLTLFEYFQTDRAGHRHDPGVTRSVLACLDEFLAALKDSTGREGCLFLMTSDHGNVEDSRSTLHTRNPVPFVAVGECADALKARVNSLTDVTPALVELMSATTSRS